MPHAKYPGQWSCWAAPGLIDLITRRDIEPGSTVLYAHLGGQPALNAYSALSP